jgi:hypothetical protein
MPAIDVAVYSLIGAIVFAVINVFSYKINAGISAHRRKILSFFGGVTATYVFLDLLPSLQQSSQYLKQIGGSVQLIAVYEDAIFLVVLVGFLTFFVLEHATVKSRAKPHDVTNHVSQGPHASQRIFIVYLSTTAFLYFVLSFVLIFEFSLSFVGAVLFAVGVSMHLFISDNALIEHHKALHIKYGRYVIGVVPLVGWVASVIFPEGIAQAYILLAFISGVILYHSLRNEMPTTFRKGSLAFFLFGALFYALLLIGHVLIRAL